MAKPKTFLVFHHLGKSKSGKTEIYIVGNLEGKSLGQIVWYSPWRRYVFNASGVFDSKCLSEIVNFLNQLMELRRDSKPPT